MLESLGIETTTTGKANRCHHGDMASAPREHARGQHYSHGTSSGHQLCRSVMELPTEALDAYGFLVVKYQSQHQRSRELNERL